MSLQRLATELIVIIISSLESEIDINSLAQTNRRLYSIANPILYQHNIQHNYSKGLSITLDIYSVSDATEEAFRDEEMKALREYYHPSEPTTPDGLPIPFTQKLHTCDAVIQLFLENGADLEYRLSPDLPTVLLEAVSDKRESVFWLLIKHGADLNAKLEEFKTTVLHSAADTGNIKILRFLLAQKSFDVNIGDWSRATPLHYAARRGHEAAIRLLVSHGAEINAGDIDGLTPLLWLIRDFYPVSHTRSARVLYTLLELGADIDLRTESDKRALPYTSWRTWDIELIEVLLDHGCRIGGYGAYGLTALHCAVGLDDSRIAKRLIERGADVNSKSLGGEPLLLTAIKHNKPDVITTLLENGSNIHAKISQGSEKTVLEYLKDEGKTYLVKDFLEKENMAAHEDSCSMLR